MSDRTFKIKSPPMKGDDIRDWQRFLVEAFRKWKIDISSDLEVDGEYGERTRAWTRSFFNNTGYAVSLLDGGLTPALRIKARNYRRTVVEKARFLARKPNRAKIRKRYPLVKGGKGPKAAVAFYRKYAGKKESPPGSNQGPWGLTQWTLELAYRGAPWCGVMVGKALQAAGVKGINSRVASVYFILQDGLAGRNGFKSCVYRESTKHGSASKIRQGDAVGIGGESTHVELVDVVTATGCWCWGGNTSDHTGGSVSNGGMVARNFRTWASIVYAVRPDYPN